MSASRFAFAAGAVVWLACNAAPEPQRPPEPTCLSARGGCPPPSPLVRCPDDQPAEPLAQFLTHAGELADRAVAVRGVVSMGNGTCTLLGCGSNCCNHCARSLQLGVEPAHSDYRERRATTIQLVGPAVTCRGDESLLCCPSAGVGEELVARGIFHIFGVTYQIEPAELCAP